MNNQVLFSNIFLNLFSVSTPLKSKNLIFLTGMALCFCFTGCGSDEDQTYTVNSEYFYQISEADQQRIAPSSLFRAVYQNDLANLETALKENKDQLAKKNLDDNGQPADTALAVAIKLRRTEMIPLIISRMTLDELKTPNADGRSFISLLAETDDLQSFDVIQRRYQNNILNSWTDLRPGQYFTNYDYPDVHGRNAAHYVQSKTFMDQLSATWFLRTVDSINVWSDLFWQTDAEGNNFLHTAAKFNRYDVIQWYADGTCGHERIGKNEPWGFNFKAVKKVFGGIVYGVDSTFVFLRDSSIFPYWRSLVNSKNVDGNTPMHMAAGYGSYEAARALLSCEEMSPTIYNHKDQFPVTYMLSRLDLFENPISQDFKNTFHLLEGQLETFTVWNAFYNFRGHVNAEDTDDRSAIFYASRLADKYFFEALSKYSNDQLNRDGVRPSDYQ